MISEIIYFRTFVSDVWQHKKERSEMLGERITYAKCFSLSFAFHIDLFPFSFLNFPQKFPDWEAFRKDVTENRFSEFTRRLLG